jgi:hypothetical protein
MSTKAKNEGAGSNSEEETTYVEINGVPVPKDIKQLSMGEKKEVAIELYKEGTKWKVITETTGLNPKTIQDALNKEDVPKRTGKERKDEGKKDEKEEQPKTKTVVRGAVPPLRVLDQSYAEALSFYGEKLAWYGQAVTEIGQVAMMMLFQIAKINVDDAYLKMEDFKDADEFVSYSTKYLVALFQAKDEAVKIVALEEDREKLRLKLYTVLQAIENIKNQRNEYYIKARMAMSCMDESGLRKFAFATTFSETETQPLLEQKKKREVIELE